MNYPFKKSKRFIACCCPLPQTGMFSASDSVPCGKYSYGLRLRRHHVHLDAKQSQQVWLACSCPGASRLINFCLPRTDETVIALEFFTYLFIYLFFHPCEQQATYLLKPVRHHSSPPVPDALNHSCFIDYAF